jgi:hypothetical protein
MRGRRFETAAEKRGLLSASGIGVDFKRLSPLALRSRRLCPSIQPASNRHAGESRHPDYVLVAFLLDSGFRRNDESKAATELAGKAETTAEKMRSIPRCRYRPNNPNQRSSQKCQFQFRLRQTPSL